MAYEDESGDEISYEQGGVELMLSGAGTVSALESAQIDTQIATAKRYPRSVTESLRQAETLACLDAETAESMHYLLKRGNKKIDGPSVRLAEVMAYSWGNLRVDAAVVDEGPTHLTAMASCFDLEKNYALRVQVKRRITDRDGRRFNDDMIGVTGNAAVSIAYRNAIFKVIPTALVSRIYQRSRRASLGEGTIQEQRVRALDWFRKRGVKDADVFRVVGVKGYDDLDAEHLIELKGLATAIKDGMTTIEQAFATDNESSKEESRAATTDEKIRQAAEKKRASAAPERAPVDTPTPPPPSPPAEEAEEEAEPEAPAVATGGLAAALAEVERTVMLTEPADGTGDAPKTLRARIKEATKKLYPVDDDAYKTLLAYADHPGLGKDQALAIFNRLSVALQVPTPAAETPAAAVEELQEEAPKMDARTAAQHAQYLKLVSAYGLTNQQRADFQAALHSEGLVRSADHGQWGAQDFRSANVELPKRFGPGGDDDDIL